MAVRRVAIDWDWGATGIWSARDPDDEPWEPLASGEWRAYHRPADHDRHRAWRGLLSNDLIEALQTWNDLGDEFMGRHAHQHTDREREDFWARGESLADETRAQLGSGYEVICRTPRNFGG